MDGRLLAFLLVATFGFGFLIGMMVETSSEWKEQRMFDRCLEFKKDFDLCKKEFMS